MNPVIVVVDDGHWQRSHDEELNEEAGLYCRVDGEFWPCMAVKLARLANLDYALRLQQEKAIEAGKLSVPR